MQQSYRFGWLPDYPDHRDFQYALHAEMQNPVALPYSVDYRAKMSPVEDQGDLGSCAAHAGIGVCEFLELLGILDKNQVVPEEFGPTFVDLSRMYLYCNARILDGNLSQDSGTYLRSIVKALAKWGVCRESVMAYNKKLAFTPPPTAAYQEGAKHLISPKYFSLDNTQIDQLKQCLAAGFPFMCGISVFLNFMSRATQNTGIVTMPSGSFQGGHAMCVVGYDDSKQWFIVRNSWSAAWGDKGYCYIPYAYLTNRKLASDFWTIRN